MERFELSDVAYMILSCIRGIYSVYLLYLMSRTGSVAVVSLLGAACFL